MIRKEGDQTTTEELEEDLEPENWISHSIVLNLSEGLFSNE